MGYDCRLAALVSRLYRLSEVHPCSLLLWHEVVYGFKIVLRTMLTTEGPEDDLLLPRYSYQRELDKPDPWSRKK